MGQKYRWLAEFYDDFFVSHPPWAKAARLACLGSILPGVRSVCDLACGTGTTAVSFASQGIRAYGVDISSSMCRQARSKARAAGVPLEVIQADMRDFRLPAPVDLILCEFDALNHIPGKQDLALVCRSVRRALRPGGHFFFDVNNRLAFQKVWPGTWCVEKKGIVLIMHGGYDAARDIGYTGVDWFFREGRLWRRRRERVEQVAWTPAEMRRTLRDAGFDRIRAWDAAPFYAGDTHILPGARTYYRARRAPDV